MKVLSLFDGMSGGNIALRELGIVPEVYYASEIDKFAIQQTIHNFPDTIQLGDIQKWRNWEIEWEKIDLILAGSPCQGFSFCGKQLAFNDEQSKLFFVFVDILKYVQNLNPNVKFLLENVNMKREYLQVITEKVGVSPVNINSALVSAQNRNRWYWTNIRTKTEGMFAEYIISDIPQPKDEGILLKDILEKEVSEKYYLSDKALKSVLIRLGKFTDINPDKSRCLTTRYTNSSNTGTFIIKNGIRKMTSTECDRLQTIPEWYEWVISENQHYKLLGNGWTIKVITHILQYLKA